MTEAVDSSEAQSQKQSPTLQEKVSGYLGIYLICAFISMMISLFFNEVATYPLSLFFGQEVVCETHDASYKPGQTLIVYEYYRQTPSGNELVKTLPSLGITALFYFVILLLLINVLSIISAFKSKSENVGDIESTGFFNRVGYGLKAFIINLPSSITALLLIAWFYREESEVLVAIFSQVQQKIAGII